MLRITYFYYTLICVFFVCITGCQTENQIVDDIPDAIKSDFSVRCLKSNITTFHNYSDGLWQIDFIDKDQNQASVWYDADATWKMTQTKLKDIGYLSNEAQHTFGSSGYGDAQIKDIYKTEREGMEKVLYTLYFQYTRKDVNNVEHNVFLNDDGLFLMTFTSSLNDPRWMVKLSKDHFDFIAEKYKGAEIRGYINDGGTHKYFIFHEGVVKYVSFRGEMVTARGFWKETRYELGKDIKIPDNVVQFLKRNHPDFTYTNVYYIEQEQGNEYFFVDKNHKQDLGCYINENI